MYLYMGKLKISFLILRNFLIDCISYPTDVLRLYLAKEHGKISKDQIFSH